MVKIYHQNSEIKLRIINDKYRKDRCMWMNRNDQSLQEKEI